jgi:hypothetical protein
VQKSARWRARFLEFGVSGLEKDAPRPGRTSRISAQTVERLIQVTTEGETGQRDTLVYAQHGSVGRTQRSYSAALLAQAWPLKPHLVETFKVSKDPRFAEKLEAVVGLYLNPPEHALVLDGAV